MKKYLIIFIIIFPVIAMSATIKGSFNIDILGEIDNTEILTADLIKEYPYVSGIDYQKDLKVIKIDYELPSGEFIITQNTIIGLSAIIDSHTVK